MNSTLSIAETHVKGTEDAALPDDVLALSGSIAGFTKDLYDQISKENPDGNVFLSPFSIVSALGMTYVGSRAKTASQIAMALKLRPGDENIPEAFGKLLDCFSSENAQYQLNSANNLFIDQNGNVLEDFITFLQLFFKSEMKTVNFKVDSKGSRKTINQWVEKETNSKFKELIPPGVLSKRTALVLVNAIYFKGNWQKQFLPGHTHRTDFRLNHSKTVVVEIMFQEGKFPLGRIAELDCQVLEMPYIQNDVSMFILLPTQLDGLVGLEKDLTPAILQSIRSFVKPQLVDVYLPKFKLEQSADLQKTLQKLGIIDLFDKDIADLSGISSRKDLFVSNVFQRAFIEVNEAGTEAAAATRAMISLCYPRNPVFRADRPFLFFIQHNKTGAVLFIGRVCRPNFS